ncbi:MAG: hypothetical protein HXX10_03880 [Rhodoplanes sp.]|uniref:hypothetical protein n=1 Tax=Rhodoplanes sp. TaxID=1968906 RepID=UPI00178F8899|nr:hypothetical protein [Rhodoplanes sp.]NVO13153.1 hypothetical protein [Rhodoplanes sp.]
MTVLLIATAGPVFAQTPLPAADESVLADRRLAAGYIRTGNADLAALALERLMKSLGQPYAARAKAALAAVDDGDLQAAGQETEALAADLAAARRAAGRRVLADCVGELVDIYAALDQHRTRAPDLGDGSLRAAITSAAAASDAAFARCDGEAPAAVKTDPDFRRLVDGARASLDRLPAAVAAGDGELLHRFLIELRAFEQLLRFRYG